MITTASRTRIRAGVVALVAAVGLSGCSFSPYELPLPGGADLGADPYEVKVDFRDVLDLVPQSAVRVNDVAVGRVKKVELNGWTARVTLQLNGDTQLPDDAVAQIRQTSLLGEKFVDLAVPEGGGTGRLSNGDTIPLERSGRNPEIEEVFSAASLLLNGGGIEKTNTIVRELGQTLDGNEPEVKELLRTSERFLGQLDDNKEALLTSLEKVNRLALATTKQEAAITNALDDLPEALSVINNQRDDLVDLLQSLDRLGDVATRVVRESKSDTLKDLDRLEPVLRNLADSGDSLVKSMEIVLSFPFTDAIVSNSPARALVSCSDDKTILENVQEGACYGDYANLDIHLSLNAQQALGLIGGVFSLICSQFPEGIPCPFGDLFSGLMDAVPGTGPGDAPPAEGATPQLPDLLPGLLPKTDGASEPSSRNSATGAPPVVCKLLGMCRPPAESYSAAEKTDVGRLLVGPAVAR